SANSCADPERRRPPARSPTPRPSDRRQTRAAPQPERGRYSSSLEGLLIGGDCGGQQLGRPFELAVGEPGGREPRAAVRGEELADAGLVGLRGRCRKGERDVAKTQVEEAI